MAVFGRPGNPSQLAQCAGDALLAFSRGGHRGVRLWMSSLRCTAAEVRASWAIACSKARLAARNSSAIALSRAASYPRSGHLTKAQALRR